MGRGGQEMMEGTDTELSKACDALLSDREALKGAQAELHAAESAVASAMQDAGKKSVKHDGRIIRLVHTDAVDKIQIKTDG